MKMFHHFIHLTKKCHSHMAVVFKAFFFVKYMLLLLRGSQFSVKKNNLQYDYERLETYTCLSFTRLLHGVLCFDGYFYFSSINAYFVHRDK